MKKILLVDDEPAIRNVFSDILQEEGYSVLAAEGAEAALELLEHEKFDLILLDKKMPKMNGLEFIKEIRKRSISSKIILISGSFSDHSNVGCDGYLSKPCEIDQMLKAIKKVLG